MCLSMCSNCVFSYDLPQAAVLTGAKQEDVERGLKAMGKGVKRAIYKVNKERLGREER